MSHSSENKNQVNDGPEATQNEMEEQDATKKKQKIINVHQFYPMLDHTFDKPPEAIKSPEEYSASANTNALVVKEEDSEKEEEDKNEADNGGETNEGADDENNSSDKADFQKISSEGVFSTAVSEETLEAAKARGSKGNNLFKPEDWTEVKTKTIKLNDILDKRAATLFDEAMQKKNEGNIQCALNLLNKALSLKDYDAAYYVERAELYVQMCDFQSAILNYKKACLLEAENEEFYDRLSFLYFFYGQILFDQRLYPEALEAFSRASEMKPENVGYHIRSITCLAALQRHGECLALVNKRLDTDKHNPDLYIMRARLHEMFRNTTLSYYDVKDALELNQEHEEARTMMKKLEYCAEESRKQAVQLNIMGKFREALQKISISIETNPSVASYHVLRGALHRKLGDYNAAIDDFLLALDKCDHHEDSPVYKDSQRQLLLTYNDFAIECFTKGFYEEAIMLLNKAIKGEKREKGLYINRGDCFFRQGELNFSLQDFHQALEIDPRDDSIRSRISIIHNEFGVNAYQDKNYTEADAKFTLAIQYNPMIGQYYVSRSRTRYMLENVAGARQDLILGLLLDPNSEDILSILSRLFPGKSVGDVISSKAALQARMSLQNLVPTASPILLDPVDRPEESNEDGNRDEYRQAVAVSLGMEKLQTSSGVPDLKTGKDDYTFNVKMAEQRREINQKVKSRLNERKSLKYNGPRVKYSLPHPAPETSSQDDSKEKKSTNWKKFTVGLG